MQGVQGNFIREKILDIPKRARATFPTQNLWGVYKGKKKCKWKQSVCPRVFAEFFGLPYHVPFYLHMNLPVGAYVAKIERNFCVHKLGQALNLFIVTARILVRTVP